MQHQFGLPSEGIKYLLDLFLKSSSFTRYLLDDVLPKEVFNNGKGKGVEVNLDVILEECETLMVSLKTFKQLSRFLNIGDAGNVVSENYPKKIPNEKSIIPMKLVETFQIIESRLKSTNDLKQYQLYYCELCDDTSHLNGKFKEHFASKEHTSTLLKTSNQFLAHHCKSCGLYIMATQSLLDSIINSQLHLTFDKTFEKLKLKLEDKNTNASNKTAEYYTQISGDTKHSASSENSDSVMSDFLKGNDEDSTKESCEEEKSELCSIDDDNSSHIVKFYKDKWSMPDEFVDINDQMLSGKIRYCHYCRPCNQSLITAEDWFVHKQSQLHMKNTKGNKNYHEKCFNCSFHIFSRKPALNAFLRYHKVVNHRRTNNSEKFEDKKKAFSDKKFKKSKSVERNFSSSWKNSSYFNTKKTENLKNDTKQEQAEEFEEEHQIDEPETLLNTTYEVKPQDAIASKKLHTSPPLYREVIALQKKVFIENNCISHAGACLLCIEIIKEELDWVIHIKHKHSDNFAFVEDSCKKCKIAIYGPREVITKEIWATEEHQELHKLIDSHENNSAPPLNTTYIFN